MLLAHHKKSYLICDEITNFHEIYFLKYKTETAKTVQRQLHILHNISKFRNFVTSNNFSIDMPTTLD